MSSPRPVSLLSSASSSARVVPLRDNSRIRCFSVAFPCGSLRMWSNRDGIKFHYIVDSMELLAIKLEIPENGNIIVGHSHFIKTVEDIYEAIVNTVPQMKFGVAFNEASGACLIRVDGNDDELKAHATRNAQNVAAGHTFFVSMR